MTLTRPNAYSASTNLPDPAKYSTIPRHLFSFFFFLNDTPPTEIYPLPLPDALPAVFSLPTTGEDPPRTRAAPQFAETVIKTAVSAIEKAYDFESAVTDKQRLEKLASTDALTGCMNRRALAEALAQELDRARRYNLALTILLADLDRFKSINDTRGHIAGDSVLRQVGELLRREARSVDIMARYGGEEFVGVMPETAPHGAAIFAERLRRRFMAHDLADPR